jgi:pyrroline-5-carboxylate reductase
MKIVVIGAGNMGGAIVKGLETSGLDITIVTSNPEKIETLQEKYSFTTVIHQKTIDISQAVVILGVKPQVYQSLSTSGEAKAIISVMAGVKSESLREKFNTEYIIRSMPNVAAAKGASMTTFTGDSAFKEEAKTILKSIGQTLWLEKESDIDVATALAGSGPAYLYMVAEALADGAVRMGLKRDVATVLTQGLFNGVAKTLEDGHPALLKDSVISPAGTTAYGYAQLEESGVRNAFIKAIEAAAKRAEALG